MPVFSREEIEALLKKCQELSDAELKRISGGETCSVVASGNRCKVPGAKCFEAHEPHRSRRSHNLGPDELDL